MNREIILFLSIIVIALFMTIHNNNLKVINDRKDKETKHQINRDNLLMKEGQLIKLGNGLILTRSSDLIIIRQSQSTIILNQEDVEEVISFLEN